MEAFRRFLGAFRHAAMRRASLQMISAIIRSEEPGRGEEERYRLAPDVVLLLIADGTARILDFGGNFYAISQTAALMLRETLEHGLERASLQLAARYQIEASRAERDLQGLLGDLERQGVVLGPRAPRRSSSQRERLACRGLRRMLDLVQDMPLSAQAKSRVLLGLSHGAIRLVGWPKAIQTFQAHHRQKVPQQPARAVADTYPRDLDGIIRSVAAGYPLPVECKERAVSCWSLLRQAGLPAKLVVGISLFPLESHCWCELKGQVLTDHLDKCERFTPVMTYE